MAGTRWPSGCRQPRRSVEIWTSLAGVFRSGFLIRKKMMAVGTCVKPRLRGFARTGGRVCASMGPAASTASGVAVVLVEYAEQAGQR